MRRLGGIARICRVVRRGGRRGRLVDGVGGGRQRADVSRMRDERGEVGMGWRTVAGLRFVLKIGIRKIQKNKNFVKKWRF